MNRARSLPPGPSFSTGAQVSPAAEAPIRNSPLQDPQDEAGARAGPSPRGGLSAWAAVVLMLVCSTFAYMDRQVISLVVQPLKAALRLSDTQIGLLQGFAFALCYAVMGLPVARAIDRGNRARIAAGCVAVWSVATGASGLASGYWSFLAARAATAVSEAGFSPAALSIITDLFPRHRVARATAVYLTGPPLGMGVSLLVGGALLGTFARHGGLVLPVVGRLAPWRSLFVAVGAPGLILAAAFALFVREPRRRGDGVVLPCGSVTAALGQTGAVLAPIVLGTAVMMSVNFALAAWAPTFFIRRFGLAPQAVGALLGPTVIGCSLAGSLISGVIAGLAPPQRALRRVLQIIVAGATLLAPAAALLPLAPDAPAALALFAAAVFALSLMSAMATAPIQLLAPAEVRAQMIAVGGFLLAVIGAGGGPFEVGFVTDHLLHDEGRIGLSLGAVCLVDVLLGLFIFSFAFRALPTHEAAAGGPPKEAP